MRRNRLAQRPDREFWHIGRLSDTDVVDFVVNIREKRGILRDGSSNL
jgi:hypothetical protein